MKDNEPGAAQLSEAVERLREDLLEERTNPAIRADLRTVLDELERLRERVDYWKMGYDTLDSALRSLPSFTQEDVGLLQALAAGADINTNRRLRDLAGRISRSLAPQEPK